MTPLQIASLVGLLIYFAVLLFAVSKDKKNTSVLDCFFAGRSLPFWALSITFIASWWGGRLGNFYGRSRLFRRSGGILVLRCPCSALHVSDDSGSQGDSPGGISDTG